MGQDTPQVFQSRGFATSASGFGVAAGEEVGRGGGRQLKEKKTMKEGTPEVFLARPGSSRYHLCSRPSDEKRITSLQGKLYRDCAPKGGEKSGKTDGPHHSRFPDLPFCL